MYFKIIKQLRKTATLMRIGFDILNHFDPINNDFRHKM